MKEEQAIIIGAGPCGLAAAIALEQVNIKPLIIEKGNVVNAIHGYPTHQTFFSTSEKLEIGGIAFLTEQYKPNRNQALVYYREVVKRKNLRINAYEEVINVKKEADYFTIKTSKDEYRANYVIVATGYYDHPNYMNVPGEDLPKVSHYFKEAHPYFNHDVTVVGGKNSSVDAAIELVKAGARVTVLYRGTEYSSSIKPWILPEFEALVRNDVIKMEFAAEVVEINEKTLVYTKHGDTFEIANDFVFAMTGYHPDHQFIKLMGVKMEAETGRPVFNPETMETNVEGIFIAGVIAAGNNANEIFIENGKFHGDQIAKAIANRA
ncbi:YpdA family putative bacillithiol disulfide reductase [Bacillales bacterium AN1005]|uniref:YpdA family putative bacillithiol disulfide reductase n=1 Tax=Niallia taxi TaxID=2499688 RepID=UPI0021A5451D|nr:YpdA family putative bacillithiol disulfide reductase [Niallia taxi]MCT2345301.1 YpdA family putative bacillithiol disulfide reductase [Niallia taxi]